MGSQRIRHDYWTKAEQTLNFFISRILWLLKETKKPGALSTTSTQVKGGGNMQSQRGLSHLVCGPPSPESAKAAAAAPPPADGLLQSEPAKRKMPEGVM